MRQLARIYCGFLIVLFGCMAVVATGEAMAQSIKDGCWTILQYDDNGNVTGKIEGGACRKYSSRKLAKLTDPKQIAPRNKEYLLLSALGADLSILDDLPVNVVAVEEFRSLGFLGVYLELPDENDFAMVKSRFTRAIPGAIFAPNDQYVAQASKSIWPEKPFADEALAKSCGNQVRIGMIDGFVDPNAVNLRDAKVRTETFHPRGSRVAGGDHGMIMAEMFVGQGVGNKIVGLLPSAELFAANIFGEVDGRATSSLLGLIKALRWLIRHEVRFINIGFAGRYNEGLEFVMDRISERGIVVVAPAGNFGESASPAWPAAHGEVIAVTAVDPEKRRIKSGNTGGYIDVSAVGAKLVLETSEGRKIASGTSYATPFITSVAALALGDSPSNNLASLRRYFARLATDLGAPGRDDRFGWGLVRYVPKCLRDD